MNSTGRADPGGQAQQEGGGFVICYRTYRTKRPPICHCTNTRTMEPPAIREAWGMLESFAFPIPTAPVKKRTRNCKNVFPGSGTHGPIYGANLERISRGKRHITQIITTLKKRRFRRLKKEGCRDQAQAIPPGSKSQKLPAIYRPAAKLSERVFSLSRATGAGEARQEART